MDSDLCLSIGIILAILSLPSLFAAWIDGLMPRAGLALLLLAAGLITYAVMQKPGGYPISDIPMVMLTVFGRYIY